MSPPRLVQLLGLLIVSVVMVVSYVVSDMTLQFGGLALGALVFVIGRAWETRSA